MDEVIIAKVVCKECGRKTTLGTLRGMEKRHRCFHCGGAFIFLESKPFVPLTQSEGEPNEDLNHTSAGTQSQHTSVWTEKTPGRQPVESHHKSIQQKGSDVLENVEWHQAALGIR